MIDINLFRESYGNHVREALGRNKNPDLSLCCSREPTPNSDTYLIPSWAMLDKNEEDPKTHAVKTKTRDVYSRADFERSGKTMDDFLKMMTPHQEITEYYTISNSTTVKAGHQFKKEKQIVMGNDPTSRTVCGISQMLFDSRQQMFLGGLTASSVQRKIGETVEMVNFPASQQLYAREAGIFNIITDLPRIKATFRKANVPDKTNIYGLINTDDCAMFEEKNFEKIYNTDYVQGDHLRSGSIPSMFGIKWIPTNLIPQGKMWFWLYDAIAWVPYSPLEHEMGKSSSLDFDVFFKIAESADCKRIDDKGVLSFDLTKTAA